MTQLLSPNGFFADGSTVRIYNARQAREDRAPLGTHIGYDSEWDPEGEDPEPGALTVDDAGADAGTIDVTDAGLANGSYYVAYQAQGDDDEIHRYIRFRATDVT